MSAQLDDWGLEIVDPEEDLDDFSRSFDTPLDDDQETEFQLQWKPQNAPNDSGFDYDLRGAYIASKQGTLPPKGPDGHGTDTFKKPHHPTYSTDSAIKDPSGLRAGVWSQDPQGRSVFTPGAANLKYHTQNELREYFAKHEHGVTLNMPAKSGPQLDDWGLEIVDQPLSDSEARLRDKMDAVDSRLSTAGRSLGRGAMQLAESFGTGLEYLGRRLDKPGLAEFGDVYAGAARDIAETSFPRTKALQGSIIDKPELMLDPKWWAETVPEMVPSLAAAVVPGIAGARALKLGTKALNVTPKVAAKIASLGGALIGGGVGGVLEGSSTYRQMLEQGYSEPEAARAGEFMTGMTAILNAIPLHRITGGAHKGIVGRAGTGLAEAITEWLEGPAEEIAMAGAAKDKDLTLSGLGKAIKEEANVAPPAFLLGMLLPGGNLPKAVTTPQKQPVKSVAEPTVDDLIGEPVGGAAPGPTLPDYMAVDGLESDVVSPEDVELAPAPANAPLVDAAAELAGQMRPAPPAANIDVTEQEFPIERIDTIPAPVPPPVEPDIPASNIDIDEIPIIDEAEISAVGTARQSRASRLPPAWEDPRLARSDYRYYLRQMADDIVKGGGVAVVTDEAGKVTKRTPSVNPAWFQDLAGTEHSMSVVQVQKAVSKALKGEKLGVREASVVGLMIEEISGQRSEQVDYARQQLDAARVFRKTAAEAIGITDADIEMAGQLFAEKEYHASWDGVTRSLFELADDARAIDKAGTEAILESGAADADVALRLAEIVHDQRNAEADTAEAQAEREAEAAAETQGAEADARDIQDGALTHYTAEDLAEREAQKSAAEKARQDQDRKFDADQQRDTFTLTGSTRDADVGMAAGQQDMLATPIAPEFQTAADETYLKGDKARYTGKTETYAGKQFYEVEMLEGVDKGKMKVTADAPATPEAPPKNAREEIERKAKPRTPTKPDTGTMLFAKRGAARDQYRWTAVTETSIGPLFEAPDFSLFPKMPFPNGVLGYKIIVDNVSVGEMVADVDGGEITRIHWILRDQKHGDTYKGIGETVLRSIVASQGKVGVHNALPDAKAAFWDKVGTINYEVDENGETNGEVTWDSYSRSENVQGMVRAGAEEPGTADTRNASALGQGSTEAEVHAYLAEKIGKPAVRRLLDSGDFKILSSNSKDLPLKAKKAIARGEDVFGFYHDGVSYLIADNLNTQGSRGERTEDAYAIFLHEVGVHFGMREILGDKLFDEVLAEVKNAKGALGKAAAAVRRTLPDDKDIDEEVVAWLVTDRANHDLPLIRRIIAKIRAWLIIKGFTKAVSVDALVELARGAAMKASGETMTTGKFASRTDDLFGTSRPGYRPITDAERKRLVIPPAWTDVFIADDLDARLVAYGIDKKGRTQRIYSREHTTAALREKFIRARQFEAAFPALLQRIEQDADAGIEEAVALEVIAHTGFRVGSPKLLGTQEAFGATTLKPEHVVTEGNIVAFNFPGKRGKLQDHRIDNARLARHLSERKRRGNGKIFTTSDAKVRTYLHAISAQGFKVHDFRTWNARVAAEQAMAERSAPTTPEEFWDGYDAAGDAAADKIGDTRKVALDSYVDPLIFLEWRQHAGVEENATRPPKRKRKASSEADRRAADDGGTDAGDARLLRDDSFQESPREALNFDPANSDILFARRATPPLTATQVMNRSLRENDRKIVNKAKQFLKRQLFPGGLLPDQVFKEKITRDSKIEVIEFDTRNLIGQLESAIKKDYGRAARRLDVSTSEKLSKVLAGEVDPSVPEAVRVRLEAMRQYLDGLSKHYLAALFDDIKELQDRLAAAGKDIDSDAVRAKIALFETITGNIGKYVHRSYRAFDDPRWFKSIPEATLNAGRQYLIDRHLDKGETQAEAKRRAEVALHEILKTGTAYDSMEAFIKESKLGAKDLSVLQHRKDIAPEIRALLGEYTDPRLNFAKSASKMARLVFNHLFLKQVRAIGMGQFLFEGTSRPPAATKQIAAASSESYAPLNGLWTFPHIEQAFRDALGKEQMANWYRVIVQINGFVKFGKTVLSPTTAARNWQSAAFFSIANGHFDWRDMTKSIDGFREYFTNQGGAAQLAYLRNLKRLGVVYDVPYAGEMMRLLDDSQMADWLQRGNVELTVRKGLQYAQNFYRFGDDFWKIIGFENEKRALMKHGFSATAAETEAAERIRNTYPTYSMVGRFVNSLRRFPLAGTFVSFPAEIVRTSYHMLRYTAKDWKNEKTRPMAYRRAAGLAIAAGFAYAIQEVTKAMFGVDDDEEEAYRDLAAPWQRNSNFAFTSRDEKGNTRYFDISFLDPYNYWKRPITAILRNEPWQETFLEVARETLTPFFGVDILAGSMFEVMANKKFETGAPVFKKNDDPLGQLGDIINHMLKSLQPGLLGNIERTIKAYKGDVLPSGREFTVKDEMAAWVGWRVTTVNPRAALYYRSWEFQDDKTEASQILRDALNNPNEVDDDELRDAYETAKRRRGIAYTKMARIVAAARAVGMADPEIRRVLRDSKVSSKDVYALMNGTVPRMSVTSEALKGATKKAGVLFDAETKDRIRERYQAARKMSAETQ